MKPFCYRNAFEVSGGAISERMIREVGTSPVGQWVKDGYINATGMCQATGTEWYDNKRTKENQAVLEGLARSPQIRGRPIVKEVTTPEPLLTYRRCRCPVSVRPAMSRGPPDTSHARVR
jgi:hypothetical protein